MIHKKGIFDIFFHRFCFSVAAEVVTLRFHLGGLQTLLVIVGLSVLSFFMLPKNDLGINHMVT